MTVVVRKTLHEIPARLLLQKTPEAGKRILLERIGFVWKRLKFSRKVTFRNIFRYKKRFIMTVFGVAGCMALLIAAFGLRDSIKNILDIQYKQISRYDVTAVTADGTWKKQNHDQYEDLPLHMKKANVTTKTKNYVYAILITVSFVILTNLVMARKINKIDMVSAMKAND